MMSPNFKQLTKTVLFYSALLISITSAKAQQRVGIGTAEPVSTLNLIGPPSDPSLPDTTSSGVFRIGINPFEGIDFGKMGWSPFSGWIQSGYAGIVADPLSLQPLGGNVGIGTDIPNNSALLDLNSTSQGFLPPRLTFAQRNSIVNPEAGLVLYCKDCSWDGQLQVYNGNYWESMMGTPGDDLPAVGDPGPNGIIFYVFQPGDPGYIAGETHGLSVGVNLGGADWGCVGVDVPGADGTSLGTGLQNTIDIVAACSGVHAASMCASFDAGYLPSKDELILLKNSGQFSISGSGCHTPFFECQWWSSSEINADSVWILDYPTNTFIAGPKDDSEGNVIPIFSF